MALSVIKEEFKNKVVAFGKSAAPLFKRDDIDDLAIIALESGDKLLLSYFDVLPPLDILKKRKTDAELGRPVNPVETVPTLEPEPEIEPVPVPEKKRKFSSEK